MADNKVIFEVVTTAKGVKVVQKQTDDLAKSTERADRGTKKLTKSRDRYSRTEKGVAGISSNSTKNFSKMQQSIDGGGGGGLVRSYALLAANVFAVTAAFGVLSRSAEIDILTSSMERLSAVGGTSIKGITRDLVEASGGAIDFASGMRQVALASSAGISGDKIKELTSVARGASQALGRDMGDSLDRIFRGAIKLEPELLDEIGLFVRVDEASEKYAQTIGKTAGELTQFEKRQGFLNAVTEQGTRKFQDFADSVDPNVYSRLAASFADIAQGVLSFFNKALGPMIGFLVDNKILIVGLFSAIAYTIGKQIVPSLGQFTSGLASTARASAQEANEYIVDQEQKLDAYQKFQKGVKAGEAKVAKTAAKETRDGFKGKQFESTAKKGIDAEKNLIALNTKKFQGAKRQEIVEDRITVLTKARVRANKDNKKVIDEELAARKQEVVQLTLQKKLEKEITLEGKNQLTTTTSSIAARNQAKLNNVAVRSAGLANVAGAGEVGGLGAGFGVLKDTLKSGKVEVDGVSKSLTGLNKGMFAVQGGSALLGQGIQKLFMIMGPWMMLLGIIAPFLPMLARGFGLTTEASKELGKATTALAEQVDGLNDKFKIQRERLISAGDSFAQARDSIIASGLTIVETLTSVLKLMDETSAYLDNRGLGRKFADFFGGLFGAGKLNNAIESVRDGISQTVAQVAGSSSELTQLLARNEGNVTSASSGALASLEVAGKRRNQLENDRYNTQLKISKLEKERKTAVLSGGEDSVTEGLAQQIVEEKAKEKSIRDQITEQQKTLNSLASVATEFLITDKKNIADILKLQKDQTIAAQVLKSAVEGTREAGLDFATKFLPKTDVDAVTASFTQLASASKDASLTEEQRNIFMSEVKDTSGDINKLLTKGEKIDVQKAKTSEEIADILAVARDRYKEQQAILIVQASKLKEQVKIQKQLSTISKESTVLLAADFKQQKSIRDMQLQQSKIATTNAATTADTNRDQLRSLMKIKDEVKLTEKIEKLGLDKMKTLGAINALYSEQTIIRENQFKEATAEFEQEKLISGTMLKRLGTLEKLNEAKAKTLRMEMEIAKTLSGQGGKLSASEEAEFTIKAASDKYEFELKMSSLKMAVLDAENSIIKARVDLLVKQDVISKKEGEAIKGTLDKANKASKDIIGEQTKQAGLATGKAIASSLQSAGKDIIQIAQTAGAAYSQGVVTAENRANDIRAKRIQEIEAARKAARAKEGSDSKSVDAAGKAAGADNEKRAGEQDAIAKTNLAIAKVEAMRAVTLSFIDTMKQLGPEGELIASIANGALVMTEAYGKFSAKMEGVNAIMGDQTSTAQEKSAANIQSLAAKAELAGMAIGAVGQALAASSKVQIAEIDKQIKAEKDRDGKSKESVAKIAALEQKKEAAKKKAFETNKKVMMATTIANTAAAAMAAWAPPPAGAGPLFGGALSALIVATGALSLATIAKTSYEGGGSALPKAQNTALKIGGRNDYVDVSKSANSGETAYLRGAKGSGTSANNFTPGGAMGRKGYADGGMLVGERGPEVVTKEEIIPNYALGKGGTTNVNFTISAVDGQSVQNMLNDQQGNIIQMIRDAANDNGEGFLESVDPSVYNGGSGG